MLPPAADAVFAVNPRCEPGPYPADLAAVLSRRKAAEATAVITSWAGHAETPLRALPALAAEIGVADVRYKDEGSRFGLGSFKALGGAYAVFRVLVRELERRSGRAVDTAALALGELSAEVADVTVTCATDGNHGRSVAWGASLFGARCVVFVHSTVSEGRVAAIRAYGAEVIRTPGTYDDAVRAAAAAAADNGWFIVSDTSWPGYTDVPRDVMQGYAVMVEEALAALGPDAAPTHVFVQGGVGGLAAAVVAHLWETLGPRRPKVVVVEPLTAACLLESARLGRATAVDGDLATLMAGLACGEPSLLAWKVLDRGADAFLAIPDAAAVAAMRLLASGRAGATIVGGESGVAGLAGLTVLAARPDWRAAIGLDAASRVLLFGSEGDSDPTLYAELVGRSGDAVRAAAFAG